MTTSCSTSGRKWQLHFTRRASPCLACSSKRRQTSGEGRRRAGPRQQRRSPTPTRDECESESDGGRGDQRSTLRQTPCCPPLGCLRPREHATRTLALCHWSNHTAAPNKSGQYRYRACAAIKRRRRFATSNAPDNAVYDTHSLRDCQRQ